MFAVLHIGFFFSRRRRHTRLTYDWSSDVCSSDLGAQGSGWQGQVHDSHDLSAIAGGRVAIYGPAITGDGLLQEAFADAAGRFALPHVTGIPTEGRLEERRVGKGGRWWLGALSGEK